MVRTTSRRPTRIGRLIAGLGATTVTFAGLVGAPVVLYLLGRPLLPSRLPRWSVIGRALMHQDSTGHVFAVALLVLGCVAWLTFAVSVVVELIARISNRRTWRLPGMSVQQRWAATLMTAIALTFAAPGTAALASPVMIRPAAAITATAVYHGQTDADRGHPVVVYTVNRGDYLGSIAQRYEGDFNAYKQIAAHNHIDQPGLIHTGERIELPADVQDHGVRTHATGVAEGVDAVKTAPAKPGQAPTAGDSTKPTPTHTAKPTPEHLKAATTKPHASARPHVSGKPHVSASSAATDQHDSGHTLARTVDAVAVAGTLAGLIAAGAAAVKHRETLQRRLVRHSPTSDPLVPPGGPPARLMDPPRRGDLLRLDAALRALADEIIAWPVEDLPQIVGAYLDHGDVTLMLAVETVPPPQPFVALDSGWWTLPANALLPTAPDALAPLPSLCTVGGRPGQHVLLDLEYLRVLSIAGDPVESMNLMRYLVADLCHNIWSDDLRVCIAGFGGADAEQLRRMDDQRIRVIDSIPDALDRFSRRFDLGIDTWGRPDAAPPNDILFIADPSDEDVSVIRDFERVLHEAPGVGLSVVVGRAPVPVARYHGEVSPAGTLSLEWLGSKTPAASLPSALMREVNVQLDNHRNSGDKCPLNISKAASLALRRGTGNRPVRMSGQHRRPKGVPAQTWSHGVDLMRARHARPATA
jgi:LysM repeat protein